MQREPFRNVFVTWLAIVVAGAVHLTNAGVCGAEEPSTSVAMSPAGVVAADHEAASQVGASLLANGGNAVDAAVGTLLALGVVNPFASGIGGGGFCLVRPIGGAVTVLDFRERAPRRADPDMFVRDGQVDMKLALVGGLAVGVPGEARGLEALHQKYGKLPWKDVVEPARALAAGGFVVGELLPRVLARTGERFGANSPLAGAFQRDGRWVQTGEMLKRADLARTLKLLADQGAAPLYDGVVAAAIVKAVGGAGGVMEPADLSGYRVTWRDPLVGSYRGHQVYTMPPPSSGGTTILAALNILERYDLATLGYNPESVHRIAEALKHAFADRAQWLGDADFVDVPTETLIDKTRAAARVVRPDGVLPLDEYGTSAPPHDDAGTSHVSVMDRDQNMVACTSTINTAFGSFVYVPEFGLVLNNEMADFTAQPGVANNYGLVGTAQNAIAPGKRPLSSMSPTLVTRDGEPLMAVGGSGGPQIITGTLLAIIRVIDWGYGAGRAVSEPRIHHQWRPEKLLAERMPESWIDVLTRRGHAVEAWEAYNAVQLVLRLSDGNLVGASDPRKMGRPAAVADAPK